MVVRCVAFLDVLLPGARGPSTPPQLAGQGSPVVLKRVLLNKLQPIPVPKAAGVCFTIREWRHIASVLHAVGCIGLFHLRLGCTAANRTNQLCGHMECFALNAHGKGACTLSSVRPDST